MDLSKVRDCDCTLHATKIAGRHFRDAHTGFTGNVGFDWEADDRQASAADLAASFMEMPEPEDGGRRFDDDGHEITDEELEDIRAEGKALGVDAR
jgi:hypothetical protein